MLSLYYIVKSRSRSLAVVVWPFTNSYCVGSENYWDHKIIENLLRI